MKIVRARTTPVFSKFNHKSITSMAADPTRKHYFFLDDLHLSNVNVVR